MVIARTPASGPKPTATTKKIAHTKLGKTRMNESIALDINLIFPKFRLEDATTERGTARRNPNIVAIYAI